ncbi:class I ribonucleotide reductase maintenance protein YfaE [Flocculibacter collagenilyticus]|uniref:class I ribonucleotide reductase maintenance protein YfaE n=1 Tax=Flocculibacter collagenilyticus TaxID=2744479 RepID=UPI0018F74B85|nr:class I ribonucleotide reductase maintenance protein YfaE [Flocculibacter collagenilyticus]
MPKIKLNGGDAVVEYTDNHPNLLIALENENIEVNYHCREGFCGACRCKLVSGEVVYNLEPLAFVRKGEILLCCSQPTSDIEIIVE